MTSSAVVAFVVGAFSLYGAGMWFSIWFVYIAADFGSTDTFQVEALLYGVVNVFIALGLGLGGTGALGRKEWGRTMAILGAGADIVLSGFRLVQEHYWTIFFLMLNVVIIALLLLPVSSRYFATRNPRQAVR